MIFWHLNQKPSGGIYDWLLANQNDIRSGTATYEGTPVTETTEFYQYKYVISFGATLVYTTEHFLPTSNNSHLRFTPWMYTLITLLLGWWCIPWGPPFAIMAIKFNLCGDGKRTAENLLQLAQWGWNAPPGASSTVYRKNILEVSLLATEEIRSRMAKGGFSEELGVRITPTKWADSEVEITFDFPVSDGRDWVDESNGLLLLIEKEHEPEFSGKFLDFVDGKFSVISSAEHYD